MARRRPPGLLVLAGAALLLVVVGAAIESADLFPRLRFAVQRDATELPSTRAVPPLDVTRGLPLLSMYLQPDDLKEILDNKMEHGAKWERPASLSYFDDGLLRFGGEAGVRIHGGGSRITSPRQGFRVFFRRKYGTARFPSGLLFGPESNPLKRIVVHNDVRRDAEGVNWHLANPLAYDLARRIGCITPDTLPARFFLNGEDQGLFVLTEHFDDEYFAAHMPGRRITMEIDDMEALRDNLERLRPLTMDGASAFVDLDNVTSWFLAVVFAATRDAYQGPGQFLDEGRARGGWFWVSWDMDESFRTWDLDSFLYLLERPGERPRGRRASEPRSFVLTTLISEDARFREYLAARIDTMLNHQLTRQFVEQRRAHYAGIAAQFGLRDTDYLDRQKAFLEKRPAFVRAIAEQWLNTRPGVPVSIRRAGGGGLIVDGFEKTDAYDGTYFPGREVVARTPDAAVHWYVNGSLASEGQELRVRADRPLTIVATTGDIDRLSPVPARIAAPAKTASAPAPPPAPIEWRAIPAGSFTAGCTTGDSMCDDNERPPQQASVAPFELMASEVTVNQYRALAESAGRELPRQPHWSALDHPVVNLTWDEAAWFCEAAGGRLPTELEWEYAARGGRSDVRFTTGMQFNADAVNGRGVTGADRWGMTSPIRSFPAGPFGLYDMAGNVWEWTSSGYREDGSDEPLRTIRGGSWDSSPRNLRVSNRVGLSVRGRHNLYVGIRCARSGASAPAAAPSRAGVVRGQGPSFADAGGPFLARGATLFWAPWGYKFDRSRLERHLKFLADRHVDYIRVLGQVGTPGAADDSWSDRPIDPRWKDPTYDEVIAGLTDLAYDKYGLRVEWTVFGGTAFTPTPASRMALVDRMLAMAKGREHKIMHFEVANEFYQNGFEGPEGLAELRRLAKHLQDRTTVLVALSAPRTAACDRLQQMHAGGVGEVVSVHVSRSADDEGWAAVRAPWELQACTGIPDLKSSNEPGGPFASVRAEGDPLRLAMAAAMTYLSGLGAYVLHTGPGVRGGGRADLERGRPADIWAVPQIDRILQGIDVVVRTLPAELPGWSRQVLGDGAPVALHAGGSTPVNAYIATRGRQFVVLALAVGGPLTVQARVPLTLQVVHPVSGGVLHSGALAASETVRVAGAAAYILTGETR